MRYYIYYEKSYTRHSRLKNINWYKNEYKNTQLYKPIQYTHSATHLLTRNAADEHVNLISINIKRICSIYSLYLVGIEPSSAFGLLAKPHAVMQ